MSKIKALWKHNELRRGMILLFFCVLLVIFWGQTYIANKAEGIQYVPYNDKNDIAMQLYEGETVQADFVCDKETFYGLKLYLYKKDKEKVSDTYDGRISFLITDESGTVIRKEELMLKDFYVSKAFLSGAALSTEFILTGYYQDDVEFQKNALSAAQEIILMIDSSKFGQTAVFAITSLSAFDYLITDKALSSEESSYLENAHVRYIPA